MGKVVLLFLRSPRFSDLGSRHKDPDESRHTIPTVLAFPLFFLFLPTLTADDTLFDWTSKLHQGREQR